VRMAQDVAITSTAPLLTFDYVATWEPVNVCGASRVFTVTIEPSGGGTALFSTNFLSAPLDTSRTDRTPVRGNAVDLTRFAAQDVRISFDVEIPGYYGPGLFQLDNVALHGTNDVPLIVLPPADPKVHEGEPAFLSVTAVGPNPLSYQWLKDGINIAGATNSTYTIEQATWTNRGDYSVSVSAGSLSVSSPTTPLTVIGLGFFNGGFELGKFSAWITNDVSQPPIRLAVRRNGANFSDYPGLRTRPVEGTFSASFGLFANPGIGIVRIAQDVEITAAAPLLTFDYLAVWEGVPFAGAVPPVFKVTIEPSGGGTVLFTTNIIAAPLEISRTDRTPVRGNAVDLTQFVGQDVRISFDAELRDYF